MYQSTFKPTASQRGFTLIEISIVLVIIGLLLGGVLKGQELIENAKIKRVSNDFNGIAAAIYSYLDRYNAIPGDDINAPTRWPEVLPLAAATVSATSTEINNGIIEGSWVATTETIESNIIWDHLRRANLLGGNTGFNHPIHAFGGIIGIGNNVMGHAGPAICMRNISGKVAMILDTQTDDGEPNTGLLRGTDGTTDTLLTAITAPPDTSYASNKSYSICKQL